MNMMRRFAALLAAAMLLLAVLPLSTVAASPCTVSLERKNARPGDEVTLSLSTTAVSNTDGMELHLYFDPAALEFVRGETAGYLKDAMDMKDALLVAGTKNHVCVSGIALKGASGEGVIALLTFRVKEDAPDGDIPVTFDLEKSGVMFGGKLTSVTLMDGGVIVDKNGPAGETVSAPTSTTNGITAGTTVVTDKNGHQTAVPAVTVVDNEHGTAVTDANGQPRYEYQIPITVDSVAADPGEEVTVYVSVLSARDITMAAINVQFDTSALTFVSGEAVGELKNTVRVSHETFDNEFVKLYYFGDGIDLNGDVAKLVFRVKNSAKKGDYRLSLVTSELHKDNRIVMPVDYNSGNVHVNKDGIGIFGNAWTYVIAVALVGAVIAIVIWIRRRPSTSASAKKQKKVLPSVTDVGDEDLSSSESDE